MMPKGESPKLHDTVVSEPPDVNKRYKLMPSSEHVITNRLKKNYVLMVGHVFSSC